MGKEYETEIIDIDEHPARLLTLKFRKERCREKRLDMEGLRPGKRYRGCLEAAGKNGDR